ncbi:MAG: hypothetical protein WCI31_15965 [Prolixibacteraceae bacterium]
MKTQSTAPITPVQDLGNGTWYVHMNIEEKEAEASPMMQSGSRVYFQADTVMVRALTVDAVSESIFREKYPLKTEIALLKDFKDKQMDETSEEGIRYYECQAFRTQSVALAKEVLSQQLN